MATAKEREREDTKERMPEYKISLSFCFSLFVAISTQVARWSFQCFWAFQIFQFNPLKLSEIRTSKDLQI